MTDTLLEEFKKVLGDRIKTDEPLARYTTFKVGGPADYFFEARSSEDLANAVSAARNLNVPVYILGGGSNILIGDKGIRGLVVRNLSSHIGIKGVKAVTIGQESKKLVFVEADSGVPINKLVRFTVDEGLAGLHMHLGLPGTVGGAIYMNSKWTHPEGYVGDVVYQVRLVTQKGEDTVVPQSYFQFAYDSSRIQKTKDVVISVVFALTADDKDRLWKIATESITYRRSTQPQGVFTAGCTFRNLSRAEALTASTPNLTTSAGYLIDHAGLKNESSGDAYVSPVHANFIVNRGKATAHDVIKLIDRIEKSVQTQFNVRLSEEIERVGEF
jgi:UDP-N-acetylmuramate dehydrogenase